MAFHGKRRVIGKRKWSCRDCKSWQFVHPVELNRAARLRCVACGSVRMEPHSDGAKEERAVADLNLREYSPGRGDIVKGKG